MVESKKIMQKDGRSWLKRLLCALIDPQNIANSIILAIFLASTIYLAKPLILNNVDFEVYTTSDRHKVINDSSNATIYFTFVNSGTVSLEINKIDYHWFDFADYNTSTQERWHVEEDIIVYDADNDEFTQTILVPYEKIKVHINIEKPHNLRSNSIILEICPHFKPTETTLRIPFIGVCNKWYRLIWE